MGLRVVLADDSYLVREGTAALLTEASDVEVVALAGDAAHARFAGRTLTSHDLAVSYDLTDTDGSRPDCWGYLDRYGMWEQRGEGVAEFR